MACVHDDFRSEVLGSAAQRVRALPGFNALDKAEVGELDVPIVEHQDVFRLQIAVNQVVFVQVLNRKQYLGRHKPRLVLLELAFVVDERHQLTLRRKFLDQVQKLRILVHTNRGNDKRVVQLRRVLELVINVLLLASRNHLVFGDHFDCNQFLFFVADPHAGLLFA